MDGFSYYFSAIVQSLVLKKLFILQMASGNLIEKLKHYGVASHIVTESFAIEGVTVKYVFRPWKRAYREAQYGAYDGSLIWSYDKERGKYFYFSDPLIDGKSVFFHLKNYPFVWKSIADLKNHKIGGSLGYKYAFEEEISGIKIDIDRAPTDIINFKKLLLGRIQIFPCDMNVGYAILNIHFKPEEIQKITHHPKHYSSTTYHLILTKKNKINELLIQKFNKGLSRLRETGQFDQFVEASLRGEYIKKGTEQ
ncbi:MAG: ABC transporter substrate-binding protein [Desulfobacterales bacterium]|nr:ABC transporter substrate-binding protein [Desulfobacterales bacterium]